MSLNKQLWIGIVFLLIVVFGVTFFINGVASSRYLERQLSLKNGDDAAALALSLSQQNLDESMLEIQLAAQLDQGTYRSVSLLGPAGQAIFERSRDDYKKDAPEWLIKLFPITAEPGIAKVTSGWRQLGTLTLESEKGFAYGELWASAKRTFFALLCAIALAGAVASALLKRVLSPLRDVVQQANNISDRRFTQMSEPYTTEFAQLTRAMNRMTARVREMLESSAQILTAERALSEVDALTGLTQREGFLERFAACLNADDAQSSGSFVLLRLHRLATANQLHGRAVMDEALTTIGKNLRALTVDQPAWVAGRLGGADLALLAPLDGDPESLGVRAQSVVKETLTALGLLDSLVVPTGCGEFSYGDELSQILTDLDAALLASQQTPSTPVTTAQQSLQKGQSRRDQAAQWRQRLEKALQENSLELELFPVLSASGEHLHDEAMLRLRVAEELIPASVILPWAYRLGLVTGIDRAVITRALDLISQRASSLCINLTLEALNDSEFIAWLQHTLRQHTEQARYLSVEVSEAAVFLDRSAFRALQECVSEFGVQVGLDHVGFRVEDVGLLSELGLDYLKIDGLFVRGMQQNIGKRSLLQTYATITKTLGIDCIAEGVSSSDEMQAVFATGASGATGPGVRR